ncbi:MAG: hypothetical protein ACOYBP_05110 [Microbacteriaceae bacterium]
MIDWFFGLLTPNQWEAWRNSLATLGGLIALVIATRTYRRSVKIKREEQARLVYSKVTHITHHDIGEPFDLLANGSRTGNAISGFTVIPNPDSNSPHKVLGLPYEPLVQATVVVRNGSKELIGPARVQMVNGGTGTTWDEFSISVAAIDPESDYVVNFTWPNEVHPGQYSLSTTVIFRDASGQWWRRHRAEPIEQVHSDPENQGPTAIERVQIRAQQERMGIPEERRIMDPHLTLHVRWQRYRRVRAGKSPTP